MKVVKNSFFLIIIALIITVAVQNMEAFTSVIPFKIFNSDPVSMPFALWLLLAFAVGYSLAFLLSLKKSFADKSAQKKLIKQNDALNKELQEHRNKFLDTDEALKVEEESLESV